MQQLDKILSSIHVIPFGEQEAKSSASIRAKLEKQGTPIDPYDILIGGTAMAHNAILVTRNTSEFQRIDKLQIVDWF